MLDACSDSDDSSVEELEIKSVRPAPRSVTRQVFNEKSDERSKSPTSILSLSGDNVITKKCLDVSIAGDADYICIFELTYC